MDENKRIENSSDDGIGAENENILARRRAAQSSSPPPSAPPAYATRRPQQAPSGQEARPAAQRPVPPRPEGTVRTARPAPPRPEGTVSAARPVPPRPEGTVSAARPAPQRPEGTVSAARPAPQRPEGTVSAARPAPQRPAPPRPEGTVSTARPVPSRAVPQNPAPSSRPIPRSPSPMIPTPAQNPDAASAVKPQSVTRRPSAVRPEEAVGTVRTVGTVPSARPTSQRPVPRSIPPRPEVQRAMREASLPRPESSDAAPAVSGSPDATVAVRRTPAATPSPVVQTDLPQPPAAPVFAAPPLPTEPSAAESVPVIAEEPEALEAPALRSAPKKAGEGDESSGAKIGADMIVGIVKAVIYMVVVLVVSVFISIYVIRVGNDVFAFVKSDEVIDVVIPDNADVEDIADILHDNGIISFPGIFKLYAGLKKDNGPFEPGTYSISPSMSYDDLRRSFKKQPVRGTVWITIPEGYTTDEIIDLLVENGIGKRKNYIDVINNYDFDYWFIDAMEKADISKDRAYRLDGYLFPDTYEFYLSSSEVTVIDRMLRRFDEIFVNDYRDKAAELGYTVDEILTIASLVEKEAGNLGQFPDVSAVFHNRLNNPTSFPRMESDATTIYAIQIETGKRPDSPEGNTIDSPYNTYLYDGLPPGPITNPSMSAIRYALYPAQPQVDEQTGETIVYYFFVTDKTGGIYFARNKEEHNANIEKVKQINESLAS